MAWSLFAAILHINDKTPWPQNQATGITLHLYNTVVLPIKEDPPCNQSYNSGTLHKPNSKWGIIINPLRNTPEHPGTSPEQDVSQDTSVYGYKLQDTNAHGYGAQHGSAAWQQIATKRLQIAVTDCGKMVTDCGKMVTEAQDGSARQQQITGKRLQITRQQLRSTGWLCKADCAAQHCSVGRWWKVTEGDGR